jgi:Domain of unknown function (DUF4190)
MATRATGPDSAIATTKPVWPFVLTAVLAIPTALLLSVLLGYGGGLLNPWFWRRIVHLDIDLMPDHGMVEELLALAIGLTMLIAGIYFGVKRSHANGGIIRAAASAAPIGHTKDGQPIYPIVGYTPDGTPVRADSAVGLQPHMSGTNGLAIAALITAFVIPLVGVILGHVAMSQIRKTGQEGSGLALAGLIIGYIFLAVNVLAVIALVVMFQAGS